MVFASTASDVAMYENESVRIGECAATLKNALESYNMIVS